MRRGLKGSFTVEAALLIPFILFLFGMLIQVLFYYHDKNVLMAKTLEAAVYGSGRLAPEEAEIQKYFRELIAEKMLLFTEVTEEVTVDKDKVTVSCVATKDKMSVAAEGVAAMTSPESFIRGIRKMEKIGDEVSEYMEDIHQE